LRGGFAAELGVAGREHCPLPQRMPPAWPSDMYRAAACCLRSPDPDRP
jgi:hypothetical protein